MLLKIYPSSINKKYIDEAIKLIKSGGVIIIPTDTVYAFACDLNSSKGFEKLCRIRGIAPEKANFSLLFSDLSNLSQYTSQLSNSIFKLLKKSLPGPFTYILEANNQVPKIFKQRKKTIGIRVPDNEIVMALIESLGNPLVVSSVHNDDEILDYITDPEMIHERWGKQTDAVIDGGYGNIIPSTVVDCSEGEIKLVRQGLGNLDEFI